MRTIAEEGEESRSRSNSRTHLGAYGEVSLSSAGPSSIATTPSPPVLLEETSQAYIVSPVDDNPYRPCQMPDGYAAITKVHHQAGPLPQKRDLTNSTASTPSSGILPPLRSALKKANAPSRFSQTARTQGGPVVQLMAAPPPSSGKREMEFRPTRGPGSTSTEGRTYGKLVEVYSSSGDTAEFTRNFEAYLRDKIPIGVWVCFLLFVIIFGFLIMLFGSFNVPFCHVQPMIPIWMIVSGCLWILSAIVRIYGVWPESSQRQQRRNLIGDLVMRALEAGLLIANLVWLILGAVWVYGAKEYVNFEEGMFEYHYCEPALYWMAFIAVTVQLLLIAFLILAVIILLIYGANSTPENPDQELP